MGLLELLRRSTRRLVKGRVPDHPPSRDDEPRESGGDADPGVGRFGFRGIPGETSLASMTPQELLAWENRDVPSICRDSDKSEALADERQDGTTSLNFPLHWTSAKDSWKSLFDLRARQGISVASPGVEAPGSPGARRANAECI